MDASARWVDTSVHQAQPSAAPASGVPPPPCEPPPPRDASQRLPPQREVDEFGGEAPSQQGQAGNRKQRRGHLIQQSAPAEDSSSGPGMGFQFASGSANQRSPGSDFTGGFMDGLGSGAYGQAPGGAGLGIAAGAAAVGPVVSASPGLAPGGARGKGSPPGGGRGRDPLVVGPLAVGSAAGPPSSFGGP